MIAEMTHADIVWQLLSALAVMATVLASYLKSRSERKSAHAVTTQKIAAVQETVNGANDALAARVDQLGNALGLAGETLPSKPPQPKG
jgi:hypothetical protein